MTTARDLVFTETWSVPEFKQRQGVLEIEVKQNEKTGKWFFDYKFGSGACSQRAAAGTMDNPVISNVISATTGEQFFLLHQKGEGGGATTMFKL
jgi:hypothetical protein